MGDHPRELAEGRAIPVNGITPYLCTVNHLFIVVGPHILCRCGSAPTLFQWMQGVPREQDPSIRDRVGYRVYQTQIVFNCFCGSNVKQRVRRPRAKVRAAEAIGLLTGWHDALMALDPHTPARHTRWRLVQADSYYRSDRLEPTFPSQPRWWTV